MSILSNYPIESETDFKSYGKHYMRPSIPQEMN